MFYENFNCFTKPTVQFIPTMFLNYSSMYEYIIDFKVSKYMYKFTLFNDFTKYL